MNSLMATLCQVVGWALRPWGESDRHVLKELPG